MAIKVSLAMIHAVIAAICVAQKAQKGYSLMNCNPLICIDNLVGVIGFEPTTPCTPCKCATRLRHTPKT